MNSTEWEITLHLHDFDEFWMRYTSGKSSDIVFLNSSFQDNISISVVLRNYSEISIISKIRNFYVIVLGIQNDGDKQMLHLHKFKSRCALRNADLRQDIFFYIPVVIRPHIYPVNIS